MVWKSVGTSWGLLQHPAAECCFCHQDDQSQPDMQNLFSIASYVYIWAFQMRCPFLVPKRRNSNKEMAPDWQPVFGVSQNLSWTIHPTLWSQKLNAVKDGLFIPFVFLKAGYNTCGVKLMQIRFSLPTCRCFRTIPPSEPPNLDAPDSNSWSQ